eukprot:CAMPEP_0203945488 /NCGR_PEP_ID=MMETSP0359-20131031/80992_1 /ASSEMBLY_ACC=CAM_ASM_000338 /TAXON_ID=268821 /ORGANISM="Scrippsiella Hangoei, Strain SHTV-5" /LENGTH=40 /DNA_ID= /DNA_START= /DNA_END= /DNA_ORIENTATION=
MGSIHKKGDGMQRTLPANLRRVREAGRCVARCPPEVRSWA